MMELFDRPDEDKFFKAVQAVAEDGTWPDLAPFREAARHEEHARRRRGLYVLAYHGTEPGTLAILLDALTDPETVVRTAVLTAIGRHGLGQLVPDICRIFLEEGDDPQLAKAASETLGKLADARAIEPLRLAKSRFPTFVVRSACDMALRKLGAAAR